MYPLLVSFLSFVVVLGILIFVHELGHFLVARRVGVLVERFSLGFGPKIAGVTRGETEYRLSLVPLGGYVKLLGQDADEEVAADLHGRSFSTQSVGKRAAIVLAGPLSNFLLAILIYTMVNIFVGIEEKPAEFGTIVSGSPAEQAGLKAGDQVISIDGTPTAAWEDVVDRIEKSGGKSIELRLDRNGQTLTINVTPVVTEYKNLFGETLKKPAIGVTIPDRSTFRRVNPLYAGYDAIYKTWELSKLFLVTISKLIQRVVPLDALGGPILIAQMAGRQAEQGLLYLIGFMAFISVNLGVLNLLPIPVLDGGHLFFFLIEAILGRPLGVKKVEFAQKVGLIMLLTLMLVVFYNDIMRLIPGYKPDFMP